MYMTKKSLGVADKLQPLSLLWELDIPDAQSQINLNKLRFHHKLTKGQTSVSSLYNPGNYLYELNGSTLNEWFPSGTPNAVLFSKWKWSVMIKKEMTRIRKKVLAQSPMIFDLKPNPDLDEVLLCLNKRWRCALIRARHGMIDYNDCKCGATHENSLKFLEECDHAPNVVDKIVANRRLINAKPNLKKTKEVDRHMILLGKKFDINPDHRQQILESSAALFMT